MQISLFLLSRLPFVTISQAWGSFLCPLATHNVHTECPYNPSDPMSKQMFDTEHKMCREQLQRHVCQRVCHKYRHEHDCCFNFPHKVVVKSHFDPETNSLLLLCLDKTLDYHNPYILVLERHNHDLKWILSSRAAKVAIMYITNYVAKGELNSVTAISLLNRAVLRMPLGESGTDGEWVTLLMNHILSTFMCRQ